MDFSKFKTSTWLLVGGAVGMLIFGLFFDWAKVDFGFGSVSSGNAFDWARGWISWILVVGAGVVAVLVATGTLKRDQAPWSLILLGATGLATLLMLLLVLTGPDKSGVDLDRAIGLWLSFLATIVALVGAVMNFTESGGNLADLKDPNKLKGAFGKDGGSTPPPPPPPPSA